MSRLFLDVLAKRRVEPLLMSSSGSHVVLAIDSRDLRHGGRDLIEAVSGHGQATAEAKCAVVSVVGAGLGGDPAVVSQIFNAIQGIEVGLIVHGSSPLTMSVVVAESDVEQTVSRLHGAFFEKLDPQVFE
jgi:aspartate kinase